MTVSRQCSICELSVLRSNCAALAVLSESPSNIRAGAKQRSPAPKRRQSHNLEDSIADILKTTLHLTDDCNKASRDCLRVRRKSKELGQHLGDLAVQASTLAGAAQVWRSLAPKIDPALLTETALREAFDAIDVDGSGKLEGPEVAAAIKKGNPDATDEMIQNLIKFADTDGDGTIDFEEYMAIMRTGVDETSVQ